MGREPRTRTFPQFSFLCPLPDLNPAKAEDSLPLQSPRPAQGPRRFIARKRRAAIRWCTQNGQTMDPIKPSRCHALQFIACPQLILPVDVDARADLAWPPPLGISRGRGGVRWLDWLGWYVDKYLLAEIREKKILFWLLKYVRKEKKYYFDC